MQHLHVLMSRQAIASIIRSCRMTIYSLLSHLGTVRAGEVELDVGAVGLQDVPGAVLEEWIESTMECVAPAGAHIGLDQ